MPSRNRGSPKLSVTPTPPPTLTMLKHKQDPLEFPSMLPSPKKMKNPFLSLLFAAPLPSTLPPPTLTLMFKMQCSTPSCTSTSPPALSMGVTSRMISKTPRSSWASLTTSEKAGLHQRMLEGCAYWQTQSSMAVPCHHNSFHSSHSTTPGASHIDNSPFYCANSAQ